MMRSSCTGMKEDHYNAVIRSRIIRRLRVQDLRCLWVQDSVLHLERKALYISGIVYKCSLARTTLRGGNRCGRSTIAADAQALAARLQAYVPPGLLAPSSNAAPAQGLPTLVHAHPSLITVSAWGFRPAWSDWRDVPPVIHARAETVASKPYVRQAFQTKRCPVLADGFDAWQRTGKGKVPYRIALQTGEPFACAGIWS